MYSLVNLINLADTAISPGSLPQTAANSHTVSDLLSIVFGTIGALAFLMIVISGLRYILSAGDAQKMSKAKNGLVYALVGLAIALAAESIVAFVAGNI